MRGDFCCTNCVNTGGSRSQYTFGFDAFLTHARAHGVNVVRGDGCFGDPRFCYCNARDCARLEYRGRTQVMRGLPLQDTDQVMRHLAEVHHVHGVLEWEVDHGLASLRGG